AGTLASYLLGDSVKQFSFIIGVYLFSMGIGSYFSKFLTKNLLNTFVEIEILVGLIGGLSSVILFLMFESAYAFQFILYFLVFLIPNANCMDKTSFIPIQLLTKELY